MRLLLSTVAGLLITSCGMVTHIPATSTFTSFDVSDYTARGFMFTPAAYPGGYESLGAVNVAMYQEGNKNTQTGMWSWEAIDVDVLLAEAHRRAVEMGGDALMSFQVQGVSRRSDGVDVPGLQISGFAIRRLD